MGAGGVNGAAKRVYKRLRMKTRATRRVSVRCSLCAKGATGRIIRNARRATLVYTVVQDISTSTM
jgi:hypothetical protein